MQDIFKSLYVLICFGGLIAALTAFVIISRRSSVSNTWEPLVPIVNGTLERKYITALLQGVYGEHPVQATLITGGAENPDTFQIQMKTVGRGADWLARYGSGKLFGRDQWYIKADHPMLQQRLDQSGLLAELQQWDSHPTIRYESNSGTLLYEEDGTVPNPERFQAQLGLLLRIAGINEQLNTGERFMS